jgi:hypothetical protein
VCVCVCWREGGGVTECVCLCLGGVAEWSRGGGGGGG